MNISTTKKELQAAFSKLTKTTQVKSQNPLVNYTYISSGAHGVTLHSTDMEVGIKTQITASVNTNGEGLFPTSEVNDIISVIDEGSCLLYTSPSPRDGLLSRMPSSA